MKITRQLIGSFMLLIAGVSLIFLTEDFWLELFGMVFVGAAVVNHTVFLQEKT